MTSTLDQLLVSLEVRLEAFALLDVRRGYRLVFDSLDQVIVHYVLSGTGWLETPGGAVTPCPAGSVVILPARLRQAFRVGDGDPIDLDAGAHCLMVKDGIVRFDAALGGPPDLQVLCGSIMAASAGSFGLFEGLKQPLLERFEGVSTVAAAFDLLRAELASPSFGTRALAGAIMKLCLVLLIRKHLTTLAETSPLVAALGDQRLCRAVAAVVDAPADDHTVASLAAAAGMSRSAFARGFSQGFAMSPMEFVAKTRLHHAAELLRSTDLPVKAIAASIGSPAAATSRARSESPMAGIRAAIVACRRRRRLPRRRRSGATAPTMLWRRSRTEVPENYSDALSRPMGRQACTAAEAVAPLSPCLSKRGAISRTSTSAALRRGC